jgi:AbrB family looped-hinge helix DNA binding protein
MSEETVAVNKRGQFTIPSKIRKQLGIQEGTKLLITRDDSAMILRKLLDIDALTGIHSGQVSADELNQELDSLRKQDRY